MKELTWNELLEVPDEIKFIYVAAFMNIPILTRDYKSARKKYPEYFEELQKQVNDGKEIR